MYKRIISIALKGIALTMSVAVIVMNTLHSLDFVAAMTMIGIGLFALALESLQKA